VKTTKTAVVTGSTGGIGAEISKYLAETGWNLVLLNRSEEKAGKQISTLKASFSKQMFFSYTADMMDLSSLQRALAQIRLAHPEISALYNIAGLLTDKRIESAQGIEAHFAVNTLAPYLITQWLRSPLSAGARSNQESVVVYFSSSAINSVKTLEISKLENPSTIGGLMGAYAQSKLALTMMSEHLTAELLEEGILVYSVDPGPTKTQMTGSSDGMPWFLRMLRPLMFKSAESQTNKLVTSLEKCIAEGVSGAYLSEGKRKETPAIASNTALQSSLRTILDKQIESFI